jgi:DNA modification methylase
VTGTQAALYAEIDLELSWSEEALPQSERTKHVHGLHPYLGKFPPQLAEALIERHCPEGGLVLDPFCGSGTTLVEAIGLGRDATGCDVSAFNALLAREKTRPHDPAVVAAGLDETLARAEAALVAGAAAGPVPAYLAEWYGDDARRELLAYRAAIEPGSAWSGLAALVLSRAARSARLVRHDALDAAREPVREPYWCHKHRRTCVPTAGAMRFLRRYSSDAATRIAAFAELRSPGAVADVHHLDARDLRLERPADALVTSPPYVGVIDYHDQHAYAYALLALEPRARQEIGSRLRGASASAVRAYATEMVAALAAAASCVRPGAPLAIVVNDRLGLYGDILERAGLQLESRSLRHVNRRTSRRAGEYYEEILVARRPQGASR